MNNDPFCCMPSIIWKKLIKTKCKKIILNRYDCLDHFAINLILPNHTTINVCSNPDYILTYRELCIYRYSSGLYPELIDHLPVIPWRLLLHKNDHIRLNKYISFKEVLHGLYSGMSFVHKADDIHLNVAVATRSQNQKNSLTFLNNAEDILNLGAYFYGLFKDKLESFFHIQLPNIDEISLNNSHYREIDKMARNWYDKKLFII